MLIVHVTSTDPAGAVINFVNATNAHTGHRARLITTMRIDDFNFPQDLGPITDGGDEVEALLEQADIIHFHKVQDDFTIEVNLEKRAIKKEFVVGDYIRRHSKKVVYHIHGHPTERNEPDTLGADYARRGRPLLASTPDLEAMYKPFYSAVQYFPNCVPINNVLYLPRATEKPIALLRQGKEAGDGIMVCQTPTHTILKNVHVIRGVVEELAQTLPVFYFQIWQCEQELALRHKRNAHIVFDHMEGYYGLSSLEGLSMGKPTMAGLSDYTVQRICDFFGIGAADLPWLITRTREELKRVISDIATVEELRWSTGMMSRAFMENVWSDKNVGQRLAAFYEAL